MVQQALLNGCLPHGVNKGLIVLLHKYGATNELSNYRPMTLLSVSYKIIAKGLQKKFQLFLPDTIDEDLTSFLPMRYILDNVLVQAKTIEWSKESHQDLILLKLDFKKAYDTISLSFLFRVMHKLGFLTEFLSMVKLLFMNAEVSICINRAKIAPFSIQQEVRQTCLLAPCLFLIVD